MTAYYNEFDPKKAALLRELISRGLIADGEVDERPIEEVQANDFAQHNQVHLFAGIGGWSLALRIAGVADDARVWTGSCPCRRFSSANRGRGVAKDCWPEMFRLIVEGRPGVVLGEQVKAAMPWMDGVCNDMESENYAVWSCVLPAYCVGKDHARERIYFACHANGDGEPVRTVNGEMARLSWLESDAESVVFPHGVSVRMAYDAFGDAIVPQVAAAFIEAYLETKEQLDG